MNYPDSSTVNTTAKKISFSSATRALLLGLALLLPVAAALAIGTPIPGIDIVVKKNPGGIIINAPTGADGAYQFKGLAAGNYELSVGGKRVQTIRVGDKGSISGVLSRQPEGTASITFNGQVGVVPDLPGALAIGEPIPGIDIVVRKNPGDSIINAPTGADGAYQFKGLAPGSYDLFVAGQRVQTITVGDKGAISGKVMRSSDGVIRIWDDTDIVHSTAISQPITSITILLPPNPDAKVMVNGDVKPVTPFSFGSGNTLGSGPGRGAGPGMDPGMRPGAGPAIGGPMSPGPSPVMGGGPMGQGGAMGRPGAGKP